MGRDDLSGQALFWKFWTILFFWHCTFHLSFWSRNWWYFENIKMVMRKWSHRYCTSYFHISDKSGTFQFLLVDLPEKKGTFWNQWKSLIKSLTLIFGYDQWSFLFWDKFEHLSLPEVVHHWKHHKDRIIGRSCNHDIMIMMMTIITII